MKQIQIQIPATTIGKKVKVYRNLHTGTLSIQAKVEGRWKVVGHESNLTLSDIEFKVSEAGRQRVIRERSKNVHAFIVGVLVSFGDGVGGDQGEKISYNPYKSGSFYRVSDGEPVAKGEMVKFENCVPYLLN